MQRCKIFPHIYLFKKHIIGKRVCNSPKNIIKNIENKIIIIDKLSFESKNKCYYCDSSYNREDNLKRHIIYNCKKKKY